MISHVDTIIAPITAPGRAAIAVVRLSGSSAFAIANKICPKFPANPTPRKAFYGIFSTGDDGIALGFNEGSSFTGDQTVEFSIHGSPVSVKALLNECINQGARMAEPGEFTQRALMNGKLDLTQAEGILATINSSTTTQFHMANRLRSGGLLAEISEIREICLSCLATIEAYTDFSEELGELDHEALAKNLTSAQASTKKLLQTKEFVRLTHNGATVAIIGKPNAGKSSLLNALINQDRAIVTEIPGTTRDTIEEVIEFAGIPIKLIDTAGIRETNNPVEKIGVDRAMSLSKTADLILYIYDAKIGWTNEDEMQFQQLGQNHLIIANKSDLNPHPPKGIPISTTTRAGFDSLATAIKQTLIPTPPQDPIYLLDRHYNHLEDVNTVLKEAITTIKTTMAPDLASVQLRQAIRLLGQISGENPSADILHEIFSRFCLGK